MNSEHQQQYCDTWKVYFQETIKATVEYMRYDQLKEEASPYEKAINDRQYEPLVKCPGYTRKLIIRSISKLICMHILMCL